MATLSVTLADGAERRGRVSVDGTAPLNFELSSAGLGAKMVNLETDAGRADVVVLFLHGILAARTRSRRPKRSGEGSGIPRT